MATIEVDTDSLRDEGRVWLEESDEMATIKSSVDDLWLSLLAFFMGYPDAGLYARAYWEFRTEMATLFRDATTEFEFMGKVLKVIADDYDNGDDLSARRFESFEVAPDSPGPVYTDPDNRAE